MRELERSALLPHAAADAYRVVAAVEDYPAFVPGCVLCRVESSDGDRVRARLGFRLRGLSDTFVTENLLLPERRIEVSLLEGPFRQLQGAWEFQPLSDSGCKVRLTLTLEFGNRVMEAALAPWLERATGEVMGAFIQRIRTVCDRGG